MYFDSSATSFKHWRSKNLKTSLNHKNMFKSLWHFNALLTQLSLFYYRRKCVEIAHLYCVKHENSVPTVKLLKKIFTKPQKECTQWHKAVNTGSIFCDRKQSQRQTNTKQETLKPVATDVMSDVLNNVTTWQIDLKFTHYHQLQ